MIAVAGTPNLGLAGSRADPDRTPRWGQAMRTSAGEGAGLQVEA
jgi:hypothetical protein